MGATLDRTGPTDPDSAPRPSPGKARGRFPGTDVLIAAAVAIAALLALVGTSHDYGIVWDEGHTVRREETLRKWFDTLVAPPRGHSRWEVFGDAALRTCWPFGREEPDGHPAFYALLGLAGWYPTRNLFPPLTAYRFGPMALTAFTAGAIYLELARRCNRLAGLTAAVALLTMPRTFAHAHYAHYDMPMTCLWLLAQIAFTRALESPRWVAPFGILCGLGAATKFTGWFAPAAPALWVLAMAIPGRKGPYGPGNHGVARTAAARGAWVLAVALPVAALVLVAVQPAWWFEPFDAVRRFLVSNTTRSLTKPLPSLYLGKIYAFSLPWHNTLVLTAVTTPVAWLGLGLFGLVTAVVRRRTEPWALIWPCSWLVLMIVRALPTAPGHDGIRLFLPSIASLAVLAGLGVGRLRERYHGRPLGRLLPPALVLLAVGESFVGMRQTYPYTDSYYSAAIGGLPGAERLGFELTYYWDTMGGDELLGWLRRESSRRRVNLRFPSGVVVSTVYLYKWGLWPPGVLIWGLPSELTDEKVVDEDYVLQRRRGVYFPEDWSMETHGHPIFAIGRQGVDLLRVYPHRDMAEAFEATRDVPIPAYLVTPAPRKPPSASPR